MKITFSALSDDINEKKLEFFSKIFQHTYPQAKVELENSFFIRTAKEWNSLDQETVHAASINAFRAKLRRN